MVMNVPCFVWAPDSIIAIYDRGSLNWQPSLSMRSTLL